MTAKISEESQPQPEARRSTARITNAIFIHRKHFYDNENDNCAVDIVTDFCGDFGDMEKKSQKSEMSFAGGLRTPKLLIVVICYRCGKMAHFLLELRKFYVEENWVR